MKYITLVVFLFAAQSVRAADEWTSADTYREAAYLAIDALDWAQTRSIARDPAAWREQNNILGDHPSVGRVDAYFAIMALAHVAIAQSLPSEYRSAFQYVTISVELGWVQHNYAMGISAKF